MTSHLIKDNLSSKMSMNGSELLKKHAAPAMEIER